eukprot:m51a1_g2502 hypothetical protein (665) ;mRNA; f:127779-130163
MMNPGHAASEGLREVLPDLRGAHVYADRSFSDLLSAAVGAGPLCSACASLSPLPSSTSPSSSTSSPTSPRVNGGCADPASGDVSSNVVFFVGSFLTASMDDVARVLRSRVCGECVVYCAVSNLGHARLPNASQRQFGAVGAYGWATELAKAAMEEARAAAGLTSKSIRPPVVSVVHMPHSCCPFTSNAFLLPTGTPDSPLLLRDSCALSELSAAQQSLLALTAERLAGALSACNARCDVWTVGPAARLLGNMLQPSPAGATQPVSLILIDRGLDLVAPLSHGGNMLDRIFAVLPERGACDVCVNTAPLFGAGLEPGDVSGSLAHPGDVAASRLLDVFLRQPPKQALVFARKQFDIAAPTQKEDLSAALATVARSKVLSALRGNVGIFDLCAAGCEALECSEHERWDQLWSAEKVLQLAGDEGVAAQKTVVSQLQDLASRPLPCASGDGFKTLELPSFLRIAALAYSLVGPEMALCGGSEMGSIISQLAEEAVANPADYKWLTGTTEGPASQAAAREKLKEVFQRFVQLASARSSLRDYTRVLKGPFGASSYTSVAAQVLEDVLHQDPSRPLSDLHRASAPGVGGLLRKGFSMWGLSGGAETRPSQNSTVVLFFVGGVSCIEMQAVAEIASSHPEYQVLVGSTNITKHRSTLDSLIGSNSPQTCW